MPSQIQDSGFPSKLEPDAIEEALLEVRFLCDELPELVVGRLAETPGWKTFKKQRLPLAELPPLIRGSMPDFTFQPILQLSDRNKIVKIGPAVVSFHCKKPYMGWDNLYAELQKLVTFLFESFENLQVTRIGLRYINAFSKELHNINSVDELKLRIDVGGNQLDAPRNLNYTRTPAPTYKILIRIASPEFVSGLAAGAAALVDVDVHTPDGFVGDSKEFVMSWIRQAHDYEKEEFFSLLTEEQIQHLMGPAK